MKSVRIWFDRVPWLELDELTKVVLKRGWEYRFSQPGEWWVEFSRETVPGNDWDAELAALQAHFGKYWHRCEWG
jgi:hypothetical protein